MKSKALKKKKYIPPKIILGDLPVAQINTTLTMELEAGGVVMSGRAQLHAAKNHKDDYSRCLPHIAAIVTNPLYIGDDFKNPGKIEMISRVPAIGSAILVAVNIQRDRSGDYNVSSFYPIDEKKVGSRLDKGFLKIAK